MSTRIWLLLLLCAPLRAEDKVVLAREVLAMVRANSMTNNVLTAEEYYTTASLKDLQKFWKKWIEANPDREDWHCVMYTSRFWTDYWEYQHKHSPKKPPKAVFQSTFNSWRRYSFWERMHFFATNGMWIRAEGHACIMFYDGLKLNYFEPQNGQELNLSAELLDQLSGIKG